MSRLDKFMALSIHPMLGKMYARLTAQELAYCKAVIFGLEGRDAGAYETHVNRLFLDELVKPKHHLIMIELLLSSK